MSVLLYSHHVSTHFYIATTCIWADMHRLWADMHRPKLNALNAREIIKLQTR